MMHLLRRPLPVSVLILLLLATACAPAAAPSAPARTPKSEAAPPAATGAAPSGAQAAAPADTAVEEFYRGKTIRILVGYGAGGPFDAFSRIVAKYMSQYLPGRPTMVVENRPGAASVLVANQVYASEPKDGTVIANFAAGLVLLQALGKEGISYDAARYNWLGAAAKTVGACAARTDSGVNSLHDVLGPNAKQLIVAGIGPGNANYDMPTALNALLGTNFKVVSGYDSTAKVVLALESGEATGMCSNLDTMTSSARTLLEGDNPAMKIIAVLGPEVPDSPWLKAATAVEPLAPNDEARAVLRALHDGLTMNLPYAVAPEVPQLRVEALRRALAQALADPQLRADAQKAGFEVEPTSGEELTRVFLGILNAPPAALGRLKEILK